MNVSSRARFDNPDWRAWLEDFPEYDSMGGHVPALIFLREVKAHLISAKPITRPSDADHALLKSELETHFGLIGSQIGKKAESGLLAAVTGIIGLLADFALPGSSIFLTGISGMLIIGGSASKFSDSRESFLILSARDEVVSWLKAL